MTSRTTPRLVVAHQREERALALRAKGASFSAIATAMGVTEGAAWKACKRALDRVPVEDAEQLRATEAALLNDIRREAWQVISRRHPVLHAGKPVMVPGPDGTDIPLDDDGPKLQALMVLIRNSESMRRLFNLDAPIEVSVQIDRREEVAEQVLGRISYLRSISAGEMEPLDVPVFVDEPSEAKRAMLRGEGPA